MHNASMSQPSNNKSHQQRQERSRRSSAQQSVSLYSVKSHLYAAFRVKYQAAKKNNTVLL